MTIAEALKLIVLSGEEFYAEIAEVISVDNDKRTCDCKQLKSGSEFHGVQLQSLEEGENGIYMKPVVNSYVIIGFTAKNHAFVLVYGEIEEYIIKIGDNIVTMNSQEFKFGDGAFGGMVKVNALLSKLNAIENTFNAHVHPAPGGATSVTGTLLTPTILTDIENTKVKHG